ncbi:MAG: LptE family protein [Planctomycetota bacterium]
MKPQNLIIAALITIIGLSGCGYRAGALHRPGIETVHVELFASQEFRRDLEFNLTEALKKRINLDTPYRLAAKDKADTILKGEVLEVRQAAFATDYLSRLPREKQLTLAVRVQWKDLRSGRVLIDQPVELQAVDYLTPTGETEKFAQQRAIDRLAAKIIAKMYDEW